MGVTESKTSPRHLHFLKQPKKTTEMMSLLRALFLDTPWEHTTSATQYSNSSKYIIYAHNNQKFGHRLRGHGRIQILMDSHPYSHETSIFTLGAPHGVVQGRRTKLHPGFTTGKLVQFSPGRPISILRDSHIVLSKQS